MIHSGWIKHLTGSVLHSQDLPKCRLIVPRWTTIAHGCGLWCFRDRGVTFPHCIVLMRDDNDEWDGDDLEGGEDGKDNNDDEGDHCGYLPVLGPPAPPSPSQVFLTPRARLPALTQPPFICWPAATARHSSRQLAADAGELLTITPTAPPPASPQVSVPPVKAPPRHPTAVPPPCPFLKTFCLPVSTFFFFRVPPQGVPSTISAHKHGQKAQPVK